MGWNRGNDLWYNHANLRNIDFDNCKESDDEYMPYSSELEDSILTPPPKYKQLKRSEYPIGFQKSMETFWFQILN